MQPQVLLATMIIAIAASVLMFYTQAEAFEEITDDIIVQRCKISLFASALKVESSFVIYTKTWLNSETSIDCPTNFIKVNDESIEKSLNKETLKLDEGNKKELMTQVVLNEMARCWAQFGNYKAKIDDVEIDGTNADLDQMCITCSVISTGAESGDEKFTRTPIHIYQEADRRTYKDAMTYSQFLTNTPANLEIIPEISKEFTFEPEKTYYVVFGIGKVDDNALNPWDSDLNKVNEGTSIIDCKLFDEEGTLIKKEELDGSDLKQLGCSTASNTVNFGQFVSGEQEIDVDVTRNVLVPFVVRKYDVLYPTTVRLIEGEDVLGGDNVQCKRLY